MSNGKCDGCGVGTFGRLCGICHGDYPQTEEWRRRRDAYQGRAPTFTETSRLPLQRAADALPGGALNVHTERVSRAIGDAMSDAYRDAEEIAIEAGHTEIANTIRQRRLDMTGQRPDTRKAGR